MKNTNSLYARRSRIVNYSVLHLGLIRLTMRGIGLFGIFFAICIAISSGTSCPREDAEDRNLSKLARAHNRLAFNLYRRLASGTKGNLFFSPLSISTAFAMLSYGARGETAEELRKALGYEKVGLLSDHVHDTFKRYFSGSLKSGNCSNRYDLNSVSALLVDKNAELLEDYRSNVQELYGASVRNVDFSTEPLQIAEEINHWVRENTNDKIKKLVGELSPNTVLALMNAVYFKGAWKTRFDPKRTREEFFANDGVDTTTKLVPMMYLHSEFPVAYFDDFKVLELPYQGNISMLILLPNELGGLEDLEDCITPQKLKKIFERVYPTYLEVLVPRFKLVSEEELSGPLQTLGFNRIFNSGADFSGMTTSGNVFLSQVLHKAVIEVNEKGSEAAAVTAFMMFKSGPVSIVVNHPFMFAIVDKSKKNMVLFLGRVNSL